jgi:alanine dehydrogenase
LAKEVESPENPGAMEKRVALIPEDVKKLTSAGCNVYVEKDAGVGVGFSDAEYEKAGAIIQKHDDLYLNKELLIKFKGPAIEDVYRMRNGSILFCMAHFHSFPERAALLEQQNINVVAMEHIYEHPAKIDDDTILSRMLADHILESSINRNRVGSIHIAFLGFYPAMKELIRRFSNHNPASVRLYQPDVLVDQFEHFGDTAYYIYNSNEHEIPDYTLNYLKDKGCVVFDADLYLQYYKKQALEYYRAVNPPPSVGLRRIQCLHETGMAGAGYGLKLLEQESPLKLSASETEAVVLGYGNVGMGAIDACYKAGVSVTHILGPVHTRKPDIEKWLSRANLMVNGAEQPSHLRGKNYLITNQHVKQVIQKGAVVIDLIGGSATNRSPVEPVVECTYLTNPHFEQDDVFISALWGWPMMGMMRETAIRYSSQIVDVLLNEEKLLNGLDDPHPGLKNAIVCGPF